LLSWFIDEESEDFVEVGEADDDVVEVLRLLDSNFFALLIKAGEIVSLLFILRFLIKLFFVSSVLS